VHGHAHGGALEGRTSTGIPVYNVSMPLLTRCMPEGMPYRIVEIGGEVEERRAAMRGRRVNDRPAAID